MGVPAVVTLKLSEVPVEKSTESADVITGALFTVNVKDWLASGLTPLLALMVSGKVPPAVGVPGRVAVPSPLSTNVTPEGRPPVSESDGVGNPAVVTVNDPAAPLEKVALDPEVMDGAWFTVRVKDCEASGPTPLVADREMG